MVLTINKNNQSFAEKLYIIIIVVTYIISVFTSVEVDGSGLGETLFTTFIILLGYVYSYQIYKIMKRDNYESRKLFFGIDKKKFNWFVLVYLLIMIVYGRITGDGAAESGNLNSSSIFASLWTPDAIFGFYYCMCREEHKTFARINALIYVLYKVLLGWSGVILFVAFLELYYVFKDRYIDTIKTAIITFAIYIGGGILYSFIYPLKYSIRYGTPYSLSLRLSPLAGISALVNRLSHLKTSIFVNGHAQEIIRIYHSQDTGLNEFKSIFRPLIPSAIFKNKIFSNLGSCIYNAESGGYTGINISDNSGILYYYKLLIQCDLLSFLLCGVAFLFFCWFLKKMYNSFQTKPGQFNFLLFWIFFQDYSVNGSIETLMTQSYIKLIFFIPLLWLLGIIKVNYMPRKI